jgi:hypothetical protein
VHSPRTDSSRTFFLRCATLPSDLFFALCDLAPIAHNSKIAHVAPISPSAPRVSIVSTALPQAPDLHTPHNTVHKHEQKK